ncbi:MAG TPA: FG-GAP-like repeat-containing protein [Nocardioidaceae bacterium]|nr:FG-GAP-like repeat-containing protein [Nocardioidaceae bacterium]
MAENRSRFVLLCQQALAFGVVVAVAAPAANVVDLEIVSPPPSAAGGSTAGVDLSRSASVVASTPVRPRVSSVPLSGVTAAGLRALGQPRHAVPALGAGTARLASAEPSGSAPDADDLTVLSAPQPVQGLATVGVTWSIHEDVPDRSIAVSVRTRQDGRWSEWTPVPYHEEEGPDPLSAEGRRAEPGTDPVYVGGVDDVQVKALTASGEVPDGMELSLVDPGTARTRTAAPAIDTGEVDLPSAGADSTARSSGTRPAVTLSAGSVTRKPAIFSRRQWGADERMRDPSSLRYNEVHAGFVHHTVNANDYTRAQVPSILRGIYAYHTQARGWSDVGYNVLVDRFGRIWEGRYGGVSRPVVGAHTLGYNDDAFAMSAIGNYDIARPSAATVDAFGRLFAWKLSLHGVRASSARQWVSGRYLRAIDAHRDVGQTACPGRYLFARMSGIRSLAARYQRSFAARGRYAGIPSSTRPVVVARDTETRRVFLVRAAPGRRTGRLVRTGITLPLANRVLNAGDWNGDGSADVITRSGRTGLTYLYPGTRTGRLSGPVKMSSTSFARVRLLAAVGDLTGDGHPDLMGQPAGGAMRIFPGNGATGFRVGYVAHSAIRARSHLGIGLWDSDGSPDSLMRRPDGALVLYPGNGPGGLTRGRVLGSVGSSYDWLLSAGDLNGDGRPDLVARARATGTLWTLPGTTSGFGQRRPFVARMGRFDLAG